MTRRPLALVTGASGGIGRELARIHAAKGGDVVVVARSETSLEALQVELEKSHQIKVHCIVVDMSRPGAARQIVNLLDQQGLSPDVLINNAGVGGLGLFSEQKMDDMAGMLAVNVVALTEMTRFLLPAMLANGQGKILNVASAAAFMPGPLHAVYYASKAFVLSFSEALQRELARSGVTVTTLCPGPVKSEFLSRAGGPKDNVFPALESREVADAGYLAMMNGKRVVVPGHVLRFMLTALPRSMLASTTLKRNNTILKAKSP